MPLKRGRVRESCEFCYGRKIKCDRGAMRPACSACVRREQSCRLMTEGMPANRAAHRTVTKSGSGKERHLKSPGDSHGHHDTPSSRHLPVSPISSTHLSSAEASADTLDSSTHGIYLQVTNPSHTPTTSAAQSHSSTAKGTTEGSETIDDDLSHGIYDPFAFSDQSFSYLDHLFIGEGESLSWLDDMLVISQPSEPTDVCQMCLSISLDMETLLAACRAYFEVASPSLPVLSEDLFWRDVNNGSCSQILLCAVTCRGIVYLPIERKWDLQQQLALEFRELFIREQQAPRSSGSVSIEHLEALVLMMDFPYVDAGDFTMLHHLSSLYLTHDTLVLMTLQVGRELVDNFGRKEDDNGGIADKRRYFLLFWHVYGLDAFHCLDKQRISRIQDQDATTFESLHFGRLESFLDVILSLARLARLISSHIGDIKPGRARPNRLGIIEMLFRELREWEEHQLPAALRWPDEGQHSGRSNTHGDIADALDGKLARMHSLTIAILKLNCYLQIERYAVPTRREGTDSDIGEDIIRARVEHETLRQIQKVVVNRAWLRVLAHHNEESGGFSPFDRFLPLRDMCRGLCNWMMLHERSYGRLIDFALVKEFPSQLPAIIDEPEKLNKISILIASLRHAVASATSHSDTQGLLNEIDGWLNPT